MPAPAPTTRDAEQRRSDLLAQLDAIEVERSGDPLAVADSINAWRRRDDDRRNRALQLAQQLSELDEFGLLLDHHRAAIRAYFAATAEARTTLKDVAQKRAFPGGQMVNNSPKHLTTWWSAIEALAAALPPAASDADTARLLTREINQWTASRLGVLHAFTIRDGQAWFPFPEHDDGGQLPNGISLGAHLTGPTS